MQIYHHYKKWEDEKHNFYHNISKVDIEEKTKEIQKMFNDYQILKKCIDHVVKNWEYSMQQNLTNPNINKIAYIGQAAAAYHCKAPSDLTRRVWHTLNAETQDRANKYAKKVYQNWLKKPEQLCLNII